MKNRTGAPSQARSVTGHSGIVGAALVGRLVCRILQAARLSTRFCAGRLSATTCRGWLRWSPIAGACFIRAPSAWRISRLDAHSRLTRFLMQYLPFADVKALAVYDAFERGAYQLVSAGQSP